MPVERNIREPDDHLVNIGVGYPFTHEPEHIPAPPVYGQTLFFNSAHDFRRMADATTPIAIAIQLDLFYDRCVDLAESYVVAREAFFHSEFTYNFGPSCLLKITLPNERDEMVAFTYWPRWSEFIMKLADVLLMQSLRSSVTFETSKILVRMVHTILMSVDCHNTANAPYDGMDNTGPTDHVLRY